MGIKMTETTFYQNVKNKQENICQIVAAKNGRMVYGEEWNSYKPGDCVHVASVTKSIMALLIGIAIDRKYIGGTDQKILEFYPDYKVKRGEKTLQQVTVGHLLTMTTPYKFKSEPWTKVCGSNNWAETVLDLTGGRAGLTGTFRYSTLGIQILSDIIAKSTGKSTVAFANQYLFEPLGISPRTSLVVQSREEHFDFVKGKTPKERVWFCGANGIPAAGFGLCLSAEELVKIGQLCVDGGANKKGQIVSSEWIDQMLAPHVSCGERFFHTQYGFLWWVIDASNKVYAAIGDCGNIIYIDKSKQTVVAVTAAFQPSVPDRVAFIQKEFLPFLEKENGI